MPGPQATVRQRGGREALRLSEARLGAVLETAVDAIVTIDNRGRIQSTNPATTRMFGYLASEMIGQNVNILMPSPFREEHDEYLARYLRTGEKRIIGVGREVQARRKDGTVFPVDLAVSEVEPKKLFTGIIRDISDRKLAEARLRETDRMASIGALAAGLGHDMNNVLLPVRAHLNVLKAAADDRSSDREHLDRIHKGVAYLQQLADGLHYLAMDPDKNDDADGSTDLETWWTQTGSLLSKAVPKHVKVTVRLQAGLPPVAVPAHALTQAVLNLIVNAGEAIPGPPQRKRRQGNVRIWAELESGGSHIRLGVSDNGSGMTEDVKRRAFDMFFTTKPRGLGTGLGLALVRKVVDRVGGTVEVESAPGKGTTMVMTLPAVDRNLESGKTPHAVISIQDGRASSMVRNLLEAAGARAEIATEPGIAHILIIEPSETGLAAATSWRNNDLDGQLVLFGKPIGTAAPSWRKLEPVVIEDTYDLDAIRTTISLVMSRTCKETAHHAQG
jgi:PAS domain S-box-containing protein